jgi:hypothetical protein
MSTVDLRCEGTLHGRLTDGRWLEVKCKRRSCGYAKGTVILHTIDLHTQEVVSTKKFSEPKNQKEEAHASHNARTAVRAS